MKFAFLILASAFSLQAQWVNGFYTGNNGIETIPNIPWSKYTAIIHFAAFAGVNGSNVGNGTVNMSNIPDTAALIAARPAGKKVLLCLKDNDSFPNAFGQSAAAGTRATFVTNIASAVTSNGYDGVDLDWEANVNTSDYTALFAALRAAMPTKLITTDMGNFSSLPTVANAAQSNIDQINIMCYDLDNPGNGYSWFNDAVLQAGNLSLNTCDWETNAFAAAGVAKPKMGIGIPFYGRRWPGVQQPLVSGSFSPTTFFYRNLVTDATRWQPANQQYDSVHKGQYLSISSLNEFDAYTGTQQIADIVTWAKSQGFGGYYTFTLEYEYLSAQSGDARYPLSTALYSDVFAGCPVDSNGWCVTGLPTSQNNLLGPLIPFGASPWVFGDAAEKGVADNMAPIALTYPPALGTQLPGTVSWNTGDQFFTTTSDLTGPLSGQSWMAVTWTTIDGPATGRFLCPISSVTSTQVHCADGDFQQPSSTGQNAYLLPPAIVIDGNNISFQSWTTENPNTVWNYYGVDIALDRLWIRTGNSAYHTYAQQYEDIQWQWVLDHGYRFLLAPRASAMLGQFFRTFEGHAERLPGLYNWISLEVPRWASPAASPAIDNREAGYMLWDIALGAQVDTDPTRHAQYCSWLSTYTAQWNAVQFSDGSFPENEYALNQTYVSAPRTFTAPFQYQGAPWREAINVKSLEATYASLNDTTAAGCNNPTIAATTLTTITKAVTWQWNYGRDTSNRGIFYEVNSQSDDQDGTSPAMGTVSVNLSSTSVTGSGTNWQTAGYCDGTHFIGFATPQTIYKIASCTDNTHATLTVAFGLYGEMSNVSGSQYGIAPAAFTGCHSSATYCFGPLGDKNLTRTVADDIMWLYQQTLNPTYKAWGDEFLSAQLGGPTAGLTSAANIGSNALPCSGPACDGYVPDTVAGASKCSDTGNVPPCVPGSYLYLNLGKNFGEAFGAPSIDNALARRLLGAGPGPCTISPATLGPWTRTQIISQTITTTCTGGTITWTSSGLPAGLSGCNAVTGSSCVLSGTLNTANTYSPTITATASNTASISPVVVVNVVPSISTTSLPGAIPGTPYSQSIGAGGGTSPLTCSISSGSLSGSGLTVSPSACTVTGTPTTTVATYIFTARVTDANGISATRPLSVSVGSPCDLNGDGIVNVQDTQLAVNMSLSIIPCTANINGSGVCNSVTIQRVVTASLGGACVVGP